VSGADEKPADLRGAIPGGAKGAAAFLGIGRTSLYAGVASGRFPPGKAVTARRRVWTYESLHAVLHGVAS